MRALALAHSAGHTEGVFGCSWQRGARQASGAAVRCQRLTVLGEPNRADETACFLLDVGHVRL